MRILPVFLTFLVTFHVRANVIGSDDRVPVTDKAAVAAMGLSDEDVSRLRKTTGFVYCPGEKYNNPKRVSAALIHDSNILVTNAHALIDEQGRWREPVSKCYFRNFETPAKPVYLTFVSGEFFVAQNWSAMGGVNDFAIIKLPEHIQGARAFPPASPQVDQNLVVASFAPARPQNPFTQQHPIVQSCRVRRVFEKQPGGNSVFYSDCDGSDGGSGSVSLVKINGEWSAVGIVAGGGESRLDGHEYDESAGSYGFHISATDYFLKNLVRISGKPL